MSLLPDLGVALMEAGRAAEAAELLDSAADAANEAGSEIDALRARVQRLALHVYRSSPDEEVDRAIEDCRAVLDRLAELGDDVGLAQGWIVMEYLQYIRGSLRGIEAACLRAVAHAEASGRVRERIQAGGDAGTYPIMGPMPVDDGVQRASRRAPEP